MQKLYHFADYYALYSYLRRFAAVNYRQFVRLVKIY